MTLTTTIADPTANSYATLAEVETYLASRDGFDLTTWNALSDDQKEWRISLAAMVIDTLRYRGVKATKAQAMTFPRILPYTDLWRSNNNFTELSFDDWTECTTYATDYSYTAPVIPTALKNAQAEVAFQVIHSHFQMLSPMQEGSEQTNFVGIGKLQVQFGVKAGTVTKEFLDKAAFGATSIVKFFLKPYLVGGIAGYRI